MFLMRSAEECGFDPKKFRTFGQTELFPDIMFHSSGDNKRLRLLEEQRLLQEEQAAAATVQGVKVEGSSGSGSGGSNVNPGANSILSQQRKLSGVKRTAQTLFLITKGREIHQRIHNSAFHVKATKDVPDIIRHSDSTGPPPIIDASTVLSHCLRGRKRTTMGSFVPEELVSGQRSTSISNANDGVGVGVSLTDAVTDLAARPRAGSVENADGEGAVEPEVDEGSEDDGEDYVNDYYASENEESDGGNEATY